MNRRSFVTRLCAGIIGTAVVARIPIEWTPVYIQRKAALDYLLKHWLVWTRTMRELKDANPHTPIDLYPTAILTSRWLFEAAESETLHMDRCLVSMPRIGWRFDSIMFKGAILTYHPEIQNPTAVNILDMDQWLRYLGAHQMQKV